MAHTRRNFASSAGLLAMLGSASQKAAASEHASSIEITPIMAVAARLKVLCALDEHDMTDEEADAITREQCDLATQIENGLPITIADAVVMLLWAVAEIAGNDGHENGTYGYERGDIVVRRVTHFLAEQAGVSLDDCGGPFFLPSAEKEALALSGTVLDAAAAFHEVDDATAERRSDEYNHLLARSIILERTGFLLSAGRRT